MASLHTPDTPPAPGRAAPRTPGEELPPEPDEGAPRGPGEEVPGAGGEVPGNGGEAPDGGGPAEVRPPGRRFLAAGSVAAPA
ncbi:hypothetical protein [Nonomuraea sp. NPDC001023]|uniref:hypothetical protein n=1 Tax=unclassified Nonomuraea TaxID=2593643 RepID=UPI003324F1FD